MGRLILFLAIHLVVILVAFDDGLLQGFLCLLVPFYIVYYAFTRLESLPLRGAFLAVYVWLLAELYFLPRHSFIQMVQTAFTTQASNVSGLIQGLSKEPEMTRTLMKH
jgi:hypothetical protein